MLGELLIAAGAIERDQLEIALAEQKNWGDALGTTLVRMGMVDEYTLVRALAGQLNLPVMKLEGKRVSSEILDVIPVEIAEKHRCLPLLINGQGNARVLYLGMDDPSDPRIAAEIGNKIGMKIQPVLVTPTELEEGIRRHYRDSGDDGGLFDLPFGRSAPGEANAAEFADDLEPLEFADSPALPTEMRCERPQAAAGISRAPALSPEPVTPASPSVPSASNDAMLRALAQLLVEKGVITREELVERLKATASPKRDA
jgi:type IV pilus assembly protein PilB